MPQGIEERLRSVAQDAPPQEEKEPPPPVDREKTCPLLLRVFTNNNRHNRIEEYTRGAVPPNELQIYTWMDATLKELTSLVKEVNADARKKGTSFDFMSVYPDRNRRYRFQKFGCTIAGHKGPDDNITLQSKNFEIGDFMDIAISIPREQRRDSHWRN